METINYCGMSGGKDSTATALWCIHESGYPLDSLRFSFCDTHNESPLTYQYMRDLSDRFVAWGAPAIVTLEPERGFYDLAKHKTRFPSAKARFCTQELKVIPTRKDIERLFQLGHEVLLHSGVRRDESAGRRNLPQRDKNTLATGFPCEVFRPFIDATSRDVFEYLRRFDVEPNPLYKHGARRVGCFPCVMSRKREIAMIADKFPEEIDKRATWEEDLGATFFGPNRTPRRWASKSVTNKQGELIQIATIRDVVAWAHTGKGAIVKSGELFPELEDADEGLVCPSGMGMCE
jgi:3'-phosphoadenosine 5'-phosphosulfate sulfotransferase (PAPS reductase)/FAD synthetase